jgi:hypothetical protein
MERKMIREINIAEMSFVSDGDADSSAIDGNNAYT